MQSFSVKKFWHSFIFYKKQFLLINALVKSTAHSFAKYILIPWIFYKQQIVIYFVLYTRAYVVLIKLHVFGWLSFPQLPNFANCTHSIVSHHLSQNWFHSELYSTEDIRFVTTRLHLWQFLKRCFKTWENYQLNQADIMTLSAEYQWWVMSWLIGLILCMLVPKIWKWERKRSAAVTHWLPDTLIEG